MTAHIGDHVHEVFAPDVDLVVDVVVIQPDGTGLFRAHDPNGQPHYVAGADIERVGRHHRPLVTGGPWPVERGATVRGLLPVPPYGPWRFVGGES